MTLASWDCHVHVIGDRTRFPLAEHAGYEPPDAPVESLLRHLDALDVDRGVVVQPSVYGFDNRCLLDALGRHGDRLRGVAVPSPDAGVDNLAAMHEAGVRGIRCNLLNPGGLDIRQTARWWPWMARNGWHLQVQLDVVSHGVETLLQHESELPVVIDHMGFPPKGTTTRTLAELSRALENDRIYVKLSAPYRISAQPAPFADIVDLARSLLTRHEERCLWASDWPHTDTDTGGIDDRVWRTAVGSVCPTDMDVLEQNASDLYGR